MLCSAGATGLVGSRLVAKLAAQGHTARVLTRNVAAARAKLPFPRTEFFAPSQWGSAVCGASGVVNLAGGFALAYWPYAKHTYVTCTALVVCTATNSKSCYPAVGSLATTTP